MLTLARKKFFNYYLPTFLSVALIALAGFFWLGTHPAIAAPTLINHISIRGTSGNGATSSSVDMSGANFCVAYVNSETATPTFADSKSNTYTPLTDFSNGFLHGKIFYAKNATTGSMTFTVGGASSFSSAYVECWSGIDKTNPLDQQNGLGAAASTTIQPGSITPSQDGELIFSGNSHAGAGTMTIDSGFSITDQLDLSGGNADGGAGAFLVQSSATPINPKWTNSGGSNKLVAAIASFKAASKTGNFVQVGGMFRQQGGFIRIQ